MADATLYCKTCKVETEHMHLSGKVCICSVCGESNAAPNWREIEARINERKKDAASSLARTNSLGTLPTDKQEAKEPAIVMPPAPLPAALWNKPTGETEMIKLTPEQNEQIKTRYEAGEKVADLAAEYKVDRSSVYDSLRKTKAKRPGKAAKVKAPKTAKATDNAKPRQAAEAAPGEAFPAPAPTPPGNPVKDAISIIISGHMAELERRLPGMIATQLAEMLK